MSCTNWKKGHMPSDVTIKKIADYFGVSVEYLKDEEQKNIPSNQQVPTTGDEDFKKLYAILSTENQAAVRSHMIELLKEQMQG